MLTSAAPAMPADHTTVKSAKATMNGIDLCMSSSRG
jgi:hypothetical protein